LDQNWKFLTAVSGFLAFAVTTLLMWYSFAETLELSRQVQEVNLARDLSKEYSSNKTFGEIHKAVADCRPLYEGYGQGGKFTWQQINHFLNFLDDVAFFYSKGAIDYVSADHHFGGLIVEIYVYPEIKKYMEDVETNGKEKGVFRHFKALAETLSQDDRRREQARLWALSCGTGPGGP
jgi:hypothetical protein